MRSWFVTAIRLQRFEVGAAVLLALVVSVTALIVRWRLDAVGVRLECLTPWIYGLPDDSFVCDPRTRAFFAIQRDEAKHVLDAMAVVPYVIGLILGVGLIAREIESGTASLAWSLAGSRRRWLVQRMLPIFALLLGLLAVAAIASSVLAAGMQPWMAGRPSFDYVLYRGPDLIAVGLATFGVAVFVSAWSGRTLPVIITSALVALLLAYGSYLLFTSWLGVAAREIAVPSWFNGEYDGGRFVANGQQVAFGVVSADSPAWTATLFATFGGASLALIGATFVVVDRRRPF